jgi:HlyD family secretion protein
VLFTLAEDLTKWSCVDVDEADVGLVKVGQPATFTVDAYPAAHFPRRSPKCAMPPDRQQRRHVQTVAPDNAELLLRRA